MSEEMIRGTVIESGLSQYIEKYGVLAEKSIAEYVPTAAREIIEPAAYGKRALPLLALLGAEISGGNNETVMPAASAVEFVNLATRIFNESPEKLLDGVALLNTAYGLVFVNHREQPDRAIKAQAEIAEFIESFCEPVSKERQEHIPALLNLAIRIGAVLAGTDFLKLDELTRFAEYLGEAWKLSGKRLYINNEIEASLAAVDESVARFNIARSSDEARNVLFDSFAPSGARGLLLELVDFVEGRNSHQD